MKQNQEYKNEALAALKGNWAPAVLATLVYYLLIWIAHIKKPKQLKHVYVPLVTLGLTIFVFLAISVVRTYVL